MEVTKALVLYSILGVTGNDVNHDTEIALLRDIPGNAILHFYYEHFLLFQTFIFHGWGAQERVVAENKNKTLISIPIYHEHKLTICHGKNDKRTVGKSFFFLRHFSAITLEIDKDRLL